MRLTESSRRFASRLGVASVGALALVAVSCNRGPAYEALQASEHALAAAPEIETYAPEEFAAVSRSLREAQADYAAGRYTEALRVAQVLPDRVAAAAEVAAKSKQQSAAAWSELSGELEPRLEALAARLALLASADAISSERLATAQVEFARLSQAWAEARSAYERGDLPNAVAAGADVKGKADTLTARLGLRRTPAAPAPQPAGIP